ncbi:hypothetical protein DFJ58DRAFT_823567 [Suillus subalutaceus]|uniref:uncharacterized protein n=1 Tax=Suillus subalutaceus TaxID=48586 RepID=UPI001B865309|nr:uncharacterized protein DFJ58DRAFT_823567 [Suillus subalutaceus]KAG1831957.1 hypothetical protein DFJ58DRAFT_823567 [Suillus subalutaceus]
MAQRRASISWTTRVQSPTVATTPDVPAAEAEKWVAQWACVLAKDLVDVRIVEVDAGMSVEDACDLLLQEDIPCLAVRALPDSTRTGAPYLGLFDFSDVNAFLTLAATRHTISPAEFRANSRADQIMSAAREGRVPVHLVSNLSEKNHLETLPNNASLISLLGVFAKGTHRVLIEAAPPTAPAECDAVPETTTTSTTYLGAVSDRALLAYFANFAKQSDTATHIHSPMQSPHSSRLSALLQPSIQISQPSQSPKPVSALTASRPTALPQPQPPAPTFTFATLLSCPLHSLILPSLQVYTSVIAATSSSTVLDAMCLMSDCGVSSVAVVDDGGGGYGAGYGSWGGLTGAVSVTDVGKLVVPSESNHILSAPLHQFVSQIKEPDGSTDGADRYPVYVVLPTSTLSYAIQKLLATNSHRLFVTDSDFEPSSSPGSPMGGGLCGIVSIVDILSLFALIANVPDVDPTQRMRHRRASSTSSHSSSLSIVRDLARSGSLAQTLDLSQSSRDFARSRSGSRTSMVLSQSPRMIPTADISSPRLASSLGLVDVRDSPRMVPTLGAGDRNSLVGLDLGELMGRWE